MTYKKAMTISTPWGPERKHGVAVLAAILSALWLMTLGANAEARPMLEDGNATAKNTTSRVWDTPGLYAAQIRALDAKSSDESVWDDSGLYAAQIEAVSDPSYGHPSAVRVAQSDDRFDLDTLIDYVPAMLVAAAALALLGFGFINQRRHTQHA